jgi:hypothetical protein
MNKTSLLTLATLLAAGATATAQNNGYLLSYAQVEDTFSGSGGTVLRKLRPNEISYFEQTSTTCATASAEKWLPRTASNVMAGDENADGLYWNPGIFGSIDAVLAYNANVAGIGPDNQRTAFWSVSAPMGNAVSATPFRPGDVARIVRNGSGDGQVEYFMRQEMFVQALGMPAGSPIDIDAIAFGPNYGVFFSIDTDTLGVIDCGPTFIRDGDVLCIPGGALNYTPDLRVAGVLPNSVIVVHPEAQMDAFTANAQVTDRFGACVSFAMDVESLEIDYNGPTTTVTSCSGIAVPVPTLVFSTETGTGASLLTTRSGGQIYNTLCGPAGTNCGFGPTFGPQMGVRPAGPGLGASSYITGLSFARSCMSVLEPQTHVLPAPSPAGFSQIDYHSQFAFNVALVEFVAPIVPGSFPAVPWSQLCFPDIYAPSINVYAWPLPGPFGSFPTPAIPAAFSGKLLFQNVGFGANLELSTPCVIDV